jgi:hypothetical protein
MENINEVVNNEEVFEVMDQVIEMEPVKAGKGWKITFTILGIAFVGYALYEGGKWVVKKIRKAKEANGKTKKKNKIINVKFDEVDEDE